MHFHVHFGASPIRHGVVFLLLYKVKYRPWFAESALTRQQPKVTVWSLGILLTQLTLINYSWYSLLISAPVITMYMAGLWMVSVLNCSPVVTQLLSGRFYNVNSRILNVCPQFSVMVQVIFVLKVHWSSITSYVWVTK